MSNVNPNNPDDLIEKLCGDFDCAKPRCPYRRVAFWFVGSLLYLFFVVSYLGLRPDLDMQLMKSSFTFELALAFFILISSSLASSWLSFPDCFQRHWIKIIPVILSFVLLLWFILKGMEEGILPSASMHIGHCAKEGMLMEILPLIALIFITMKGHTTQPYWSMTMNILAVSTLGWIGLRLTCSIDDMGHSFFNHIMPFAILAAALGLFTRKLFKW